MTILKLFIASLLVSQIFATQGADVACTSSSCANSGVCPAVPTAPTGLNWVNGSSGNCAINSCPASTSSGLTGASDLFCKSCPGTANGSVQAVFANTALTGCVAASATCGSTRTANQWTNADCLACNGTSAQYAKSDKSGCQATAFSSIIILSSVLFLISFLF
ncbi:cell surface immobilization antigen (macronuclear) [Tetrahymena thermophila SB210]|uniref:Cell surface immobilization antigen n=1 Tax=Tetrahymena thermophila (strain SB210) TaxID=312017 RepID=Q232A2_TETTS|nr:cell surface immobilization antigen [Tetrahymena thermophila SB210]EAR91298.1 cell surface immobilization antigen [Tetrahymena thermophila SB210]|eukprot:XP_001011543.1 cell surface immobilization antigen [Tetrahymena thermophila SB210]